MKTRYITLYGPALLPDRIFKRRKDAKRYIAERRAPDDWRLATIAYHNGKTHD